MRDLVLRLVVNAVAIVVTAYLLPGIAIEDTGIGSLLVLAIIIAIVNAIIKPILMVLSCPFIILTLGLFIFVVNGLVLLIVDSLSGDLVIQDPKLAWAVIGGIIMAIIMLVMENMLGMRDKQDEEKD